MDDIELLKLEMKALRVQNQKQADELKILKRYLKLVKRTTEIVEGVGKITAEDLEIAQTLLGA